MLEAKLSSAKRAEGSMINELKYQVRSREIVDLVTAMRTGQLTISPYFQRNLVWRDAHKRDFIDTILQGLPFPQVFLARGPIDVDTMSSSTCVVDGQQRLNSIREYVSGAFDVSGKKFFDLSKEEKEAFLKYEVAVIDFDLDAGDDRLKEVFKRLNRTYYSLSTVEKIATEYSGSMFLLMARVLSGDIKNEVEGPAVDGLLDELDLEAGVQAAENQFGRDPAIGDETWEWLLERADGAFSKLVSGDLIFTNYEAQRKVPIMFVLNLQATVIGGYFNRNVRVKEYLERFNEEFDLADDLIADFNRIADFISEMNIPEESMWWNKANFFTMFVEFSRYGTMNRAPEHIRDALMNFERNVPKDYAQAARDAVNNRAERLARGEHFRRIAFGVEDPVQGMTVALTAPS